MNKNYECDLHRIPIDELEKKQISNNLILRNFRCRECGKEKKFVEYGWTG